MGVVVQLKEALNVVWEVKPKAGDGIWGFARNYVLSLAGVLTLGFLLLVSMLLTAGLAAFTSHFNTFIPEPLMQSAGFVVSFAVVSALFTLMFKWLPDAEVDWRDVWLGGVGTAALFEIGKFLISFYIGKQGLESTYGASASIVVVLIWIYYMRRSHCSAQSSRMSGPNSATSRAGKAQRSSGRPVRRRTAEPPPGIESADGLTKFSELALVH